VGFDQQLNARRPAWSCGSGVVACGAGSSGIADLAGFEADEGVHVGRWDLREAADLEAAKLAALDQCVNRLATAAEFGGGLSGRVRNACVVASLVDVD
jgi:hypothetical protein